MKVTIPPARPLCTHRGWGLSIQVVTMCTSSGTKAPSWQAPSPSNSFRQGRRVGLMLQTRGTVTSDEGGLNRRRCEGELDAWSPCVQVYLHIAANKKPT